MIAAYPLTERELEVLQLIVEGCSNAAIAEKLYITVGTKTQRPKYLEYLLMTVPKPQFVLSVLG